MSPLTSLVNIQEAADDFMVKLARNIILYTCWLRLNMMILNVMFKFQETQM